ncbi:MULTISPECIES: glycosyltransferase [Bacillaceae]|uniref:Glycosyltransferase n=1 Tax=Evansella alkalicola TaxID=745819 RepID=A0ABS6JVT7_9BACI|nr:MULTISPECIES: glycosyltransferase [Bacillaceae]MBU9722711.1 glycosyltransferase [Bacillus alkalicola]
MIRVIKKIIAEGIDWVLYRALKTKHKEYLSNLLTQQQKEKLKSIIKPGKKRTQLRKIERIKYRLYTLGIKDRALADLEEIIANSDDVYLKKLASWELALWHANQYDKDHAIKCVSLLEKLALNEKDSDFFRKITVLMAECYDIMGELERGKDCVMEALNRKAHVDLFFARANLETTVEERLPWINRALSLFECENVNLKSGYDISPYDAIQVNSSLEKVDSEVKVTVIIPAYNAGDMIRTSIESMLNQTWGNIEIIVADDCSSDNTVSVVEKYEKNDSRVKLIQTVSNGGAYVARNHALKIATGDFITINDADDWSHPEKIATQVNHLIKNKHIMANFSQQARVTEDLKFYRRGKPGEYVFSNMSSFMFRSKPVLDKLGYWDSVRFAGDSEFVKRVKKVFGEKSVVELQTAPLSFQRQSESSLTGHSAFGFPGYFFGVRKEYAEAHEFYHEKNSSNLFYPFPVEKRLFPVPEPMWPNRESKNNGIRHFDVIIASEFRLLGGTNMSNIEEIKAQKERSLRTGLIQMSRYDLNSVDSMNPKVRELLDGDSVQMVVYGEKVSCDLLIVRHPPILQDWQQYIPHVEAKHISVIVNQPPKRDYSESGTTLYELKNCASHLEQYFGSKGTWYPIGPLVRESLLNHHTEELDYVTLADNDWMNIINVDEWKRDSLPNNQVIKIGRHSRDQYVKWPEDRESLLKIYPETKEYEVHVLGGANSPKKVLKDLPSNWRVTEFGAIHPKDFLAELDVFVYYTHSDWVEAFGRVIFEAMAVGVPVIIHPKYKGLFGEAAIYAEIDDVENEIRKLMSNETLYMSQVEKAYRYVEEHFGYSKHASRLEEFLSDRN